MFNISSYVAKVWSNAIIEGSKTIDDVPNIDNLIDVVTHILNTKED